MPVVAAAFLAEMCDADGEMLLSTTPEGAEVHELCYAPGAPSREDGFFGPGGAHQKCDAHSYFMVDMPRFCCKSPRIEIGDKSFKAKSKVCGDVMAEFEPDTQEIKTIRGPSTTATTAQLDMLASSGYSKEMPSVFAMEALESAGMPKPVTHFRCQGTSGTLVRWTHSEPPDKAEMCNTGSPPVRGAGYSSWFCDDSAVEEHMLHCCTVRGHIQCVKALVNVQGGDTCKCRGYTDPKLEDTSPSTTQKASATAFLAGLSLRWPLRPLAPSRRIAPRDRCRHHGRRRFL